MSIKSVKIKILIEISFNLMTKELLKQTRNWLLAQKIFSVVLRYAHMKTEKMLLFFLVSTSLDHSIELKMFHYFLYEKLMNGLVKKFNTSIQRFYRWYLIFNISFVDLFNKLIIVYS